MAISPTTLDVLGPKLADQIVATTPRITYKGAEEWKHYERPAETGSRTRRFRLLWDPSTFVRGGIFTNRSVECLATLRVRTDYAGVREQLASVIQDDWHQLRDRMHELSADDTNGLILILTTDRLPFALPERDVIQVDLTYQVRYLQARG